MSANTRINWEGTKERRCTKCGEWAIEDSTNFYFVNKIFPEKGFMSECKKCLIKRATETARKHPERMKEYMKRINAKPERKESHRKWTKERRDNGKQYEYLKITGKSAIYGQRRRSKIHNITDEEWNFCLSYFDNCCAYCGMTMEEHKTFFGQQLHKEHVDHNGANNLSNCIPSCKVCNSQKWEYNIEEWYNFGNKNYTEERYNKIIQWLDNDHNLMQ